MIDGVRNLAVTMRRTASTKYSGHFDEALKLVIRHHYAHRSMLFPIVGVPYTSDSSEENGRSAKKTLSFPFSSPTLKMVYELILDQTRFLFFRASLLNQGIAAKMRRIALHLFQPLLF
jgi:hypothetical protein